MYERTHRGRIPGQQEQESSYESLKPTLDDLTASLGRLTRSSAEFLKIDAETALTFSSIALQTEDLAKRLRNRRYARKGYDTILRLRDRVKLSKDDERFLKEKLGRLKSELIRLGEVF